MFAETKTIKMQRLQDANSNDNRAEIRFDYQYEVGVYLMEEKPEVIYQGNDEAVYENIQYLTDMKTGKVFVHCYSYPNGDHSFTVPFDDFVGYINIKENYIIEL